MGIGVVGLGQRGSPMGITCWHMTPDRSAKLIDSGQGILTADCVGGAEGI